jgi:hypothetical protein
MGCFYETRMGVILLVLQLFDYLDKWLLQVALLRNYKAVL